jgi:hypothetical protein
MPKLLYVSGDDTSCQEALGALSKSGYDVCSATANEAERLLSEGRFRTVIIGPGLFHRQKVALAALARESSLSVILVCKDPSEKTIEADLYVDQTEGESGILYAVKKASTVVSYDVTV